MNPGEEPVEAQLGTGAFGDLVSWALGRVTVGSLAHRDAVIATARAVDHGLGLGYQIGGLEFHHDGSGTVDLLVHCESRRTRFGAGVALPAWFRDLVARAPEPDVDSPDAIRLTPQHWLEFDQAAQGLVLAGVWQGIEVVGTPSTPAVLSALSDLLAGPGFDIGAVSTSRCLTHFVDTIGPPRQVGIMSGRTGTVKVFRRVTDTVDPHRALRAFSRHPDLVGDLATLPDPDPDRLATALVGGDAALDIGVNLDIDIDVDRFDAGVGFEIHLLDPATRDLGRVDSLTRVDEVLERVGTAFGLETAACDGVREVAGRLPAAASWRRSYGALDPVVHPGLRHRILIARLNHLKVVLRAGHPPRIKSYVRLSVHQGTP